MTFLFLPLRDPWGESPKDNYQDGGRWLAHGCLSLPTPPAVPLPLHLRDAHQHLVLPAFLIFAALKSQVGEVSFPLHFSAYQ